MRKFLITLSGIAILGTILLIGIVTYWFNYPYNPMEFETEPHAIINKTVRPGEHVRFVIDYCKHMDLGSEITTTFVDGFLYNTTPIVSNIEVGCHTVETSIYVPRAIPPGVYSIKQVYRYQVNPIRTVDVITTTEKFTVVK